MVKDKLCEYQTYKKLMFYTRLIYKQKQRDFNGRIFFFLDNHEYKSKQFIISIKDKEERKGWLAG